MARRCGYPPAVLLLSVIARDVPASAQPEGQP
jgi:hypothetical protein